MPLVAQQRLIAIAFPLMGNILYSNVTNGMPNSTANL